MTIDALAIVNRLTDVGVTREVAEAHASALRDILADHLARTGNRLVTKEMIEFDTLTCANRFIKAGMEPTSSAAFASSIKEFLIDRLTAEERQRSCCSSGSQEKG